MKALVYVFVTLVVAALVSEIDSAALTPGNLLVVRGPFGSNWHRIYIDEITTSGTVVQTFDPDCLVFSTYFATSIIFNQDYTTAAFVCYENTASLPSTVTSKKLALAIQPNGTIDKTDVSFGLEGLDFHAALIDGRNVWVGAEASSLVWAKRNGAVYSSNMISTPQTRVCDLQMVGNEFYVGSESEDIYQIAKVLGGAPKDLVNVPNVEELFPSNLLDPYPFGDKFFMYSNTQVYYAGQNKLVFKINKSGSTWAVYDTAGSAYGVSAADVGGKRMVYLSKRDGKIVSVEDTGSAFQTLTEIKNYGPNVGVWDVAYIRTPLATCSDNVKNQDESDNDCGGYYCSPCANTKTCSVSEDCQSSYCNPNLVCSTPSCTDTFKNQDETDVDCGGAACSASKCADGKKCAANGDCSSNYCNPNKVCSVPSCNDGFLNQDEMSIDCGGTICAKCPDGVFCFNAGFCQSGYCTPTNKCATPSCSDGIRNQNESDVDCGGICGNCADGKNCVGPGDCLSGYCYEFHCLTPTCTDNIKNGNETDVDCGAACSVGCAVGKTCTDSNDCADDYCKDGVCTLPTCSDEVLNGLETDVDCGGSSCGGCEVGKNCGSSNANCANSKCVAAVCTATCSDSLKNQNETDVDCGGVCGATCADGSACKVNGDCTNNNCINDFCGGFSNSPVASPDTSNAPSASGPSANSPSPVSGPISKPVSHSVRLASSFAGVIITLALTLLA